MVEPYGNAAAVSGPFTGRKRACSFLPGRSLHSVAACLVAAKQNAAAQITVSVSVSVCKGRVVVTTGASGLKMRGRAQQVRA
jgi:hypothetical protein